MNRESRELALGQGAYSPDISSSIVGGHVLSSRSYVSTKRTRTLFKSLPWETPTWAAPGGVIESHLSLCAWRATGHVEA